ncbi:MAG: hypothetical protein LBM98_04210 [Oscillospiraceae bacterium]|nr:hypothetical protein [Oscillospiraceae bacterium]
MRDAGRRTRVLDVYSKGSHSKVRHCEAPVSLRYVERYRCEAIQCREDNIRIGGLRHWIASRLDRVVC